MGERKKRFYTTLFCQSGTPFWRSVIDNGIFFTMGRHLRLCLNANCFFCFFFFFLIRLFCNAQTIFSCADWCLIPQTTTAHCVVPQNDGSFDGTGFIDLFAPIIQKDQFCRGLSPLQLRLFLWKWCNCTKLRLLFNWCVL